MPGERPHPVLPGRRHRRAALKHNRDVVIDARRSDMARRRRRGDDSDATLLRAAQAGDDDAMAILVGRHRPAIEAWVRRRVPDAAMVDEVVARVLERLWRLQQYDPERGTIAAWVMVLTRTAFLDVLRERRRKPTPAAPPEVEVPIEDQSDRIVTASLLTELQDRLSADHREVIHLVFTERHTMAEAAQRLGLPIGTVKSRCFYALRALRLHARELGVTDV